MYTLQFISGGKLIETIFTGSYNLCAFKRNQALISGNYKNGKLIIYKLFPPKN